MTEHDDRLIPGAGNGLLDRRAFLHAGMSLAGGVGLLSARPASARPPWMQAPGRSISDYGRPSHHESDVTRVGAASEPGAVGAGGSCTPLEQLNGTITPSGLHFERHHSGIPDIDPHKHRLLIHGLVRRPLSFDIEALERYPQVSRIQFLECSGNGFRLIAPTPVQQSCGELHGMISATEWTGVALRGLLEEAGIEPAGKWLIAEGADAARMNRSIPLAKALDDALIALYQNGERLRPENGYPMRLFLPGWEGNMSIKWLQRLQVTNRPAMTREETSKYSDLQRDGSALLFTYPMGVKSVITNPSPGLVLHGRGIYQITGLAWTGAGQIKRVEVSADGGKSWADAQLDEPILPKSLTRFRAAWRWNGAPSTLLSRAIDQTGAVQPTRTEVMAKRASGTFYHYNAIQAWSVDAAGEVRNVYV